MSMEDYINTLPVISIKEIGKPVHLFPDTEEHMKKFISYYGNYQSMNIYTYTANTDSKPQFIAFQTYEKLRLSYQNCTQII
jgi:hypothetical protein